MALSDDDRRALATRLAPAGSGALDVVADAIDDGEELREIVVDVQGDVVAFTDRRALFVPHRAKAATPIGYDRVGLRLRSSGLGIDALLEDDRLILDVARGTMARLAIVDTGAPPGRASWLPVRTPPPRPTPPPPAVGVPAPPVGTDPSAPAPAPGIRPLPVAVRPPAPTPGARPTPAPGPVAVPPPLTDRHRPAHASGPAPATAEGPPVGTPSATPAPSATTASTPPPMAATPAPVAAPPATQPAGLPPAGWHPDPAGRHWWRWWDGLDWTEHVADGGSPFVDPLPPRA